MEGKGLPFVLLTQIMCDLRSKGKNIIIFCKNHENIHLEMLSNVHVRVLLKFEVFNVGQKSNFKCKTKREQLRPYSFQAHASMLFYGVKLR